MYEELDLGSNRNRMENSKRKYSVFSVFRSKLGRNYNTRTWSKTAFSSKWIREELDYDFIKQYWKQLWATKIAKKGKNFLMAR